jgi:predicted lipid-binding transport protein (Tim44 family)
VRCTIDPLNLILLIIVIFVGIKLRSVLGMRNDEDAGKSRRDAYGLNREALGKKKLAAAPVEKKPAPDLRLVETEPVEDLVQDPNEGRGLAFFQAADPAFDADRFVDGAARAYEMILTAFAAERLEDVRDFLGADVYAGFADAISARQAEGQQLETQITRLDRPVLEDARIENGIVQLDVRYRAELISYLHTGATRDDAEPAASVDLWTFERPLKSANPNWQLVATQAGA